MPAPPTFYGRDVTGKARFRRTWAGRLMLQVEVARVPRDKAMGDGKFVWVDAVQSDLFALRYHRNHKGLEPLI